MKKNRIITMIVVLLFMIAVNTGASGEGTLAGLIGAGETLLLETNNVTVTGSAEFRLDGKRFKTAEITFVQDDFDSFWQEKLKTPRFLRSDRETGFTVIANGLEVFGMEPFHQGLYYTSRYPTGHDTLLRDSLESRLLLSFLRNTATIAEPALQITREDGAVRLTVAEGELPAIMNNVLLMAGRFVGRRLFGYDYDETINGVFPRDEWTETREIFYMTDSCSLRSGSVSVTLDDEGRLTGAKGTAAIELHYAYSDADPSDEIIDWRIRRIKQHLLEIDFDMTIGEYGTSSVKTFDPEEYGVVRWTDYKPDKKTELPEDLAARVREAWLAAGLEGAEQLEPLTCYEEDGAYSLVMTDPGHDTEDGCWIYITDRGNVLSMSDHQQPEYKYKREHEVPVTVELSEEMLKRIDGFIQTVTPGLEYSELVIVEQVQDGDVTYVELLDTDDDPQSEVQMDLIIRISPTWEIMHYTCVGNG